MVDFFCHNEKSIRPIRPICGSLFRSFRVANRNDLSEMIVLTDKKKLFHKTLAYIILFSYLCTRFPERGFKTSLGLPKILIFGESGGTSRPVDLTEWYQHYDLVAEREQKYQRLRHYFCMTQTTAYQYFTSGLAAVVEV